MNPVKHWWDSYEFIQDNELPILILALDVSAWSAKQRNTKFTKERKWRQIAHQIGGISCHHTYLRASILAPKTVKVLQSMNQISHSLSHCCLWAPVPLPFVVSYNNQLQELLGVSCDNSYSYYQEGLYPIDCTQDNLNLMTSDLLPTELDDLVEDRKSWYIYDWQLFILGVNCD